MKKIFVTIMAIIVVLSNINLIQAQKKSQERVPKPPKINADSAIVMELSSGTILYEKNKMKKQYPASITKVMTTLLCLENSSLYETVTFSKNAIFGIEPGSSAIGVDVGEKLSMKDALYAVMLESANEVSSGVAEHIAGDITSFADMMNKRAQELGCTNTHFINPHGLFDENHYTCAYDMALICKEAMKSSAFREIVSTRQYQIPRTNKSKNDYWLNNHQQMLHPYKFPQFGYKDCIGGKTGYTQKARYTLVSFAKRGDMELVCVVMKAESPFASENEYTDSIKLLDYAFDNYKIYPTDTLNTTTNKAPIFTRLNNLFDLKQTPIQTCNSSYIVLPKNAKLSNVTQSVSLSDNDKIKTEQNIIGKISYKYNGKIVGQEDIMFDYTAAPILETKANIEQQISNPLIEQLNLNSDNIQLDLKFIIIGVVIAAIIIFLIILNIFVAYSRKKKFFQYQNRRFRSNSFDDFFDL